MPCRDKTAQKISAAKHYQNHKVAMKQRAVAFKTLAIQRNREYVDHLKAAGGCSRCPMKDPRALDFHHLGNKLNNVATLVFRACSIEKIQSEIDKCVILCANCHRIETVAG